MATIKVDCSKRVSELKRIWDSIGFDEINWAYTPRGKEILKILGGIVERPFYIRNHNALTSGNGLSYPAWGSTNVYSEDQNGSPVYDFTILDQVYDVYIANGFKPLIELDFMPKDLVRESEEHYVVYEHGWAYPPKDYKKWEELIFQVVKHCVERYGEYEVENWYWEIWNEPDISYWKGSFEEFCMLYDYAVSGATRALPKIKIGGPAVTSPGRGKGGEFLDRFLNHCVNGKNYVTGERGTKIDFISFHTKGGFYISYVKGSKNTPSMKMMMEDIKAGLEIINKYPELLNCNILVDECDPDVGTIYGVYDNPNFIHRNTEYYPVFLCSMVKKILELNKKYQKGVDLITSWAFYFEGKRFFEGNRTLFTNENIEKPIVNAFRMLSKLGDTQISLESSGASDPLSEDWEYDIDGIATIKDDNSIQIMIWNHHDEWWREGTEEINIEILNLPFEDRPFILKEYRIDKEHSNSYTEWVNQGMPQDPSPSQVARIKEKQGLELVGLVRKYLPKNRTFNFRFNLPLHGVSLFELEPIG